MEEWMPWEISIPGQRPYLSLLLPPQCPALTRLPVNIQLADYQLARGSSWVPPLSVPSFALIHTVPENINNFFIVAKYT